MKHTLLFSFTCVLLLFACSENKSEVKPVKATQTNIKINKEDTLYKDQTMIVIKSEESIDTFLKFTSNINDSLYLVKAEKVNLTKKLDLSKYKYKKMFITRTKEGVKKNGVNFAGHFCFVYWGCGSPCKLSAVVDMKTGIVYNGLSGEIGYEFKRDSKLIIVNPPDSPGWYDKNILWQEPSQYIWTGKKFVQVKSRS